MTSREIIPTHSAYLELKAERAGMHEGYRFLDEKRLILAAEILAALREHEAASARWRSAERAALAALRAAVGRHGIEELSAYPPLPAPNCPAERESRTVLGVRLERLPAADGDPIPLEGLGSSSETHIDNADESGLSPAETNKTNETNEVGQAPPTAVNPSPEARHCRRCFAKLPPIALELAVIDGNLERLRDEYIRTARRARALEDVLLPEIDQDLRSIDTALEELEREEAVRVRHAAG